jgi:hypothetical protein
VKRGPPKGEGGRPLVPLFTDPDRFIVITALWLRRGDPIAQRSFPVLQAADNLLTPYDSIELAIDSIEQDGKPYRRLTITNTQAPRALASNSPARRPHAAPGGGALRISRLKNLRKKVQLYQSAQLSKEEVLWRDLCFMALDFIAHGEGLRAAPILVTIGWQLNDAARARLAEILGEGTLDLYPQRGKSGL